MTQKKSARVSPTAPEPQFAGAFHPPHGRPKGKRIDPIAVAAGRKTRPMSMIIATHQLEPETSWQFLLKHFWGRETEPVWAHDSTCFHNALKFCHTKENL